METLRFRIDSRVVKNLKLQKKMLITNLVETVIHDLQMQMNMAQNAEQLQARKDQILKRINDLADKVYIK